MGVIPVRNVGEGAIMELKIVCFGDSLTEGYQSSAIGSQGFTPYGRFLQERLGKRGRVWIRGVCGETTQDMQLRFVGDVLSLDPRYVVILGGTNDLGYGWPPQTIFDNLVRMYLQAQSHGIIPVGVTIPSLGGWERDRASGSSLIDQAIQSRLTVNQALFQYCSTNQIPLVDAFTATCDSGSQELASQYSEDGLHLTTLGYRTIADLLWSQIFEPLAGTTVPSHS